MPPLNLDQEFDTEQANSQGGINGSNPTGPGVAVLIGQNGMDRADIYVGLVLDGDKTYLNISRTNPSIKMQFFAPPPVSCISTSPTTYDQNSGKPFLIGVSLFY